MPGAFTSGMNSIGERLGFLTLERALDTTVWNEPKQRDEHINDLSHPFHPQSGRNGDHVEERR